MTMVRTLRRHDNSLGDKYAKYPGKVYDAGAQAQSLIQRGLVEEYVAKGDDR